MTLAACFRCVDLWVKRCGRKYRPLSPSPSFGLLPPQPLVWFGSQVNSGRYVHVGHLSEGCVTVHELAKWSALHRYLISHRVPNSAGKRVGDLVVIG